MRIKNMYFICKSNIEIIKNIKYLERTRNNGRMDYTCDKDNVLVASLTDLALVPSLKPYANELLTYFDGRKFDIHSAYYAKFKETVNKLIDRMYIIIEIGNQFNFKLDENGFDVKLPQNLSLGELSQCIADLNKIFNQCPYLNSPDNKIEFQTLDVGSEWLTFLAVCTGGTVLLSNLAHIVDKAVKIASHIATVKSQFEQYKTLKLRNEILDNLVAIEKEVQDKLIEQCMDDLGKEILPIEDNEERGRLKLSLNLLSNWMEKGLQIYSAIESPKEIKDLFPSTDKQTELLKQVLLLNDKNDEEE